MLAPSRQLPIQRLKPIPLAVMILLLVGETGRALPPPQDTPEEILRGEIITGARSPIDGKPMTASEYAQLQAELATAPPEKVELSPKIKKNIRLLRLRKILKTIFPFLPIK